MVHAVLLGAGKSVRLGFDTPKQLIKIAGKTVMEHTVEIFEDCDIIDSITLVVSKDIRDRVEEMIISRDYRKVRKLILGGKTRRESSFLGVMSLDAREGDIVVIHDVARPFVDCKIIEENVKSALKYGAVDTVMESPDTIVRIDEEGFIVEIPKREFLRRGQTPQTFEYSLIKRAHELALNDPNVDDEVTDDCGLVLRYGLSKIYTVRGSEYNIKITYPLDVYLSDKIFQLRTTKIYPRRSDIERLRREVLVVFGGTSGIGKEIVDMAKEFGIRVHAFSRRTGVDVRKSEDVEKALKHVESVEGRINHVVNCAGILRMGKLVSRDLDEIIEEIETNYLGTINVVRSSVEYLRKTSGMIVLFSSFSYTRGRKLYSVYSSTKAAVVNLAQSVADEEPSIRINVVIPERTATPMRVKNFGKEPPETLLNPKTVALVVLELLTRDTTGSVIEIKKMNERDIIRSFEDQA